MRHGNDPGWTDGLPYALFRANQSVHRILLEAVDSLEVTINQLGIAVHIDELGELTGADLARHLSITPQSAATALNRLESLGWIERRQHPVNRRVVLYGITEHGSARADAGQPEICFSVGAVTGLVAPHHFDLSAGLGILA